MLTLSLSSFYSQNIAFDKLYGNSAPQHYYLGHYPVVGSDGLQIKWYGGIRLTAGSSTVVQIAPNNNVGIGTETPEAKLDINFEGEPKTIKFIDMPNTANAMNSILRFTWYNDIADFGLVRGGNTDIEAMALKFNGDEKLRFGANGNVGIGHKNPQEKLTVYGSHENSRILLSSYGNGPDQPANLVLWASEPGVTYTGVGIANNITNFANGTSMTRINTSRGGSYIRLLENEINFNVVSSSGVKQTPFILHSNGNASLQGKFEAKEVKVTTTPTADFVFEEDYNLPKLEDVEKHIKENKHLPEIASAKEMEKEGVNVGEFQIKLLQKIEELTLYSIEQNKNLKEQAERIKKLEEQLRKKK